MLWAPNIAVLVIWRCGLRRLLDIGEQQSGIPDAVQGEGGESLMHDLARVIFSCKWPREHVLIARGGGSGLRMARGTLGAPKIKIDQNQ
jgi:hypothetical protein